MKKLLMLLAAVGMIFTACEGGSPDDETNGNPTEQPGGNGNGGNEGGENGGGNGNGGTYEDPNSPLTGIKCANNEILYISTTCLPIAITSEDFNVRMVSNTYENGIGRFVFDGEVTNIPDNKFENNKKLEYIKLPNSITSIGNRAFYDCSSLTSVTIGNSVTSIGNSAFFDCSSLTSVTIPDSVTSIGCDAFYRCTGELIINSKIIETDYTDYNYPANSYGGWLDGSNFTKLTIGNNITKIGSYAFNNCSSLTSVTIPDSVTSIGIRAFGACSSLTSITIPDSVTSIGKATFRGCSSLASITIPDSVTSIGGGAFYDCSSLTSITIPDSVTSIGNIAFYNCSNLTSVYCKATTPPSGDSSMFSSNASRRKIYVPTASVEAYKSAEYWSNYASDIVGYDF